MSNYVNVTPGDLNLIFIKTEPSKTDGLVYFRYINARDSRVYPIKRCKLMFETDKYYVAQINNLYLPDGKTSWSWVDKQELTEQDCRDLCRDYFTEIEQKQRTLKDVNVKLNTPATKLLEF